MSAAFVNNAPQQGEHPVVDTAYQLVCVPNDSSSGSLQLTPYDHSCGGRAIPELWFYEANLDDAALIAALEQTLSIYPVLAGRYSSSRNTANGPLAVDLTNVGVPVYISSCEMTLADAVAHMPKSSPTFFDRGVHEPFVPPKAGMDPDPMTPEVPLFAVRITHFASGGTVIGVLMQHLVMDGISVVNFMANWSQLFRVVPLQPLPNHDRSTVLDELAASADTTKLGAFGHYAVLPVDETGPPPPAFAGVMPKIAGPAVCMVPFNNNTLQQMKQAASVDMPDGLFVSTDDVLTATVWKAMCTMRCAQLDLAADSTEPTTVSRACQFRQKTVPPLGAGYCGNAVGSVCTQLPVCDLLAMSVQAVALKLREDISGVTSEVVGAGAQWMREQQQAGGKISPDFDPLALTFVFSSWCFDWESANFNALPIRFDHGALVPIVCTFSTRPSRDGVDVYASGPLRSLETFAESLTKTDHQF